MADYISHLVNKIKIKKIKFSSLDKLIKNHEQEINSTISKIFNENDVDPSEFIKNVNEKIMKHTNELIIDDNNFSNVYKQLLVATHPDKKICETDDDFVLIRSSYEKGDFLTIIECAEKYKYNIDENSIILYLERQHDNLKNMIKKIKDSFSYHILIKNDLSQIYIMIDLYKENKRLKFENEQLKKMMHENAEK